MEDGSSAGAAEGVGEGDGVLWCEGGRVVTQELAASRAGEGSGSPRGRGGCGRFEGRRAEWEGVAVVHQNGSSAGKSPASIARARLRKQCSQTC